MEVKRCKMVTSLDNQASISDKSSGSFSLGIKGTQIFLIFPIVLVLSFYFTWLAGRISLGHWPIPHIDDPKSIRGFWMWTYDLTAILFYIGIPASFLYAIVSLIRCLITNSTNWRNRVAEVIVGFSLFVLVFVVLRWDPSNMMEWFFD